MKSNILIIGIEESNTLSALRESNIYIFHSLKRVTKYFSPQSESEGEREYSIDEILFELDLILLSSLESNSEEITSLMGVAKKLNITLLKIDDFSPNKIEEILSSASRLNIAILAPWCDQGLGIQAREYYSILQKNNFQPSIFSYVTTNSYGRSDYFQKEPKEWEKVDSLTTNVHYSFNTRESLTIEELSHFIISKKIRTFIVIEPCYKPLFEKLSYIREHFGLKIIAIPNIECVSPSEIKFYSIFDKVLCPTFECEKILSKNKIKCEWIGHSSEGFRSDRSSEGFRSERNSSEENNLSEKIFKFLENFKFKYLSIGGYNHDRKNTLYICEVFSSLDNSSEENTSLDNSSGVVITFSNGIPLEFEKFKECKNILLFDASHSSHSFIRDLHLLFDATIQISKKEGLCLGLFESLSMGIPVITFDAPPFNEIITSENGWFVPFTFSGEKSVLKKETLIKDKIPIVERVLSFFESITKEDISLKKGNILKMEGNDFERRFIESII